MYMTSITSNGKRLLVATANGIQFLTIVSLRSESFSCKYELVYQRDLAKYSLHNYAVESKKNSFIYNAVKYKNVIELIYYKEDKKQIEAKKMCEWECNLPSQLFVTENRLYVIFGKERKLGEFTFDGKFNELILKTCFSVAIWKEEIYILHRAKENVDKIVGVYTLDGQLIRKWGDSGTSRGCLRKPRGIIVENDMVFISDTNNHRIQVFTLLGGFLFEISNHINKRDKLKQLTIHENKLYVACWDNSYMAVQLF